MVEVDVIVCSTRLALVYQECGKYPVAILHALSTDNVNLKKYIKKPLKVTFLLLYSTLPTLSYTMNARKWCKARTEFSVSQ